LFISNQRRAGKVTAVENIDELTQQFVALASDDGGESAVEALKECFEQLTERARWALEMRFRDEISRGGIAEALGITEHGAKNLMQRAKQQLRQCVEEKLKSVN
jgi:RNA polymerase sigma-70 factor (ECF subfamily)